MSTIKTHIIESKSFDPWHNIALEEALLTDVTPNEIILYLWQNENTVVIGRNQNVWKECRWKELEENGGKLARRMSGGGAVFHDLGNLNFTFVMDRNLYDLHRQLQVILNAVKSFGVEAEFSGRNDIVVDGAKFSGNAFFNRGDASFHHGTLLVNVDFAKLGEYLTVSKEKMKAKGVTSVQSRVTNLSSFNKDITIESMAAAMKKSFLEEYGGEGDILKPSEVTTDLSPLYDKYSSWEWRFGRTPEFDVTYETRFDWGGIEVGFKLNDGLISACTVFSDAMDSSFIQKVAASLEQIPFKYDSIIEKLSKIEIHDDQRQRVITDLKIWIGELAV